jgi:disulfide bond formation protein DsbB
MILPSSRIINLLGALIGIALLAVSIYLECVKNLHPCSLCLLQRAAFVLLTLILLIAVLHNPKQRGIQIYGFFTLLLAASGAFLAGRQVWLQTLPHAPTDVCMPGFSYIIAQLPLNQAVSAMLMGSDNCGTVDWALWGWSLARWSLLGLVIFGILGVLQMVRPNTAPTPAIPAKNGENGFLYK